MASLIERLKHLGRRAPSSHHESAVHALLPQKRFDSVVVRSADARENEIFGGIQVAQSEVVAVSDLPKFTRTIQKDFVLEEHRQELCPIQLASEMQDGKRTFAVVVIPKALRSDMTEVVIQALSREFQPASPCVYIATQNVLSELALRSRDTQGVKANEAERDSALWNHFANFVMFGIEHGASDFHIRLRTDAEYSQISFRMDGSVARPRRFRVLTSQLVNVMGYMYSFHGNSNTSNYFSLSLPLECQIEETIAGMRLAFRWGQLPVHGGLKIVLRMQRLDDEEAFTSLGRCKGGAGFTSHQVSMWERNLYSAGGAILLSGVVNSGKSKTAHTLLSMLPDDVEVNSAEDPVENPLRHPGANQHSTSRRLGDDTGSDTFTSFKLMNKRMDPDVTWIGELRDRDTASAFRDSVLSGQRVIATIHAPNALMIPERLVSEEFGLTRELISLPEFLKLLVYQALVPKNCPKCALDPTAIETMKLLDNILASHGRHDAVVMRLAQKANRVASSAILRRIERLFHIDVKHLRVRNPLGCQHCAREGVPDLNGLRGRQLVAQMVEPTYDMLEAIRRADNIGLYRLYRSMRAADFDNENTDGKTPMEIAMLNVAAGELCFSEVERRFQSIDAYEHQIKQLGTRSERFLAPVRTKNSAAQELREPAA
ncbi:ATPase, T2SS/T4P/T4SS family [Trinickia acidisoli]|uniref:ATPase, T2SS/T4P/T4SS family n=1 Tax=Trinickia acidisoli TaxID=2767482 RepID=UPI001A907205|nr:ATPase, T2SS/T4P/T4SS family [Trinickia acidisoli]